MHPTLRPRLAKNDDKIWEKQEGCLNDLEGKNMAKCPSKWVPIQQFGTRYLDILMKKSII